MSTLVLQIEDASIVTQIKKFLSYFKKYRHTTKDDLEKIIEALQKR